MAIEVLGIAPKETGSTESPRMRTPGTPKVQKQLDELHESSDRSMVDKLKANLGKKDPAKPDGK